MNRFVYSAYAALFYCLVASIPFAYAVNYSEGKHYELVQPPQPTQSTSEVEVLELFWYGCPHCYQFEPYITRWLKTLPDKVKFVRMPGVMRPGWAIHARAYYAAQALGVVDKIHIPLFEAIHELKRPLNSEDQLMKFFEERGVNKEDFKKAFRSFAVETKVRRAMDMSRRYGANGVPTVIVNGKYRTSASLAGGGHANALKVVDFLVKKEKTTNK